MSTTTSGTRTLSGHLAYLLEYPKWIAECSIDFSRCDYDGQFNNEANGCASCQYQSGCRWLFRMRDIDTRKSSFPELTGILRKAIDYVATNDVQLHNKGCDCERCIWLNSARQFVRSVS